MPRNTGGMYSLPNPPFVSGTVISSTVMNQQLADLASAMTESLSRSGNGDMQVPLTGPDGSAALPTYAWGSDPGTGFWLPSIGMVRLTSSAATLQQWTTTGVTINPATTLGSTLAVTGAATLSSTLAVTGNATFDGNTTLGNAVGDTTTISGPLTANSTASIVGPVTITSGSQALNIKTTTDDAYMAFFARTATPNTRSGYLGVPAPGGTEFAWVNEMSGGNIRLTPGTNGKVTSGGNIEITAATPASTTAVLNLLTRFAIPKVLALIVIPPGGRAAGTHVDLVSAGQNVASITTAATSIAVNFAQPFATSIYIPFISFGTSASVTFSWSTTSAGLSIVFSGYNPTTTGGTLTVLCFGAQ